MSSLEDKIKWQIVEVNILTNSHQVFDEALRAPLIDVDYPLLLG